LLKVSNEQLIDKHDLTQGEVWNKLWTFFLPVAAGQIVQQLYNTADGLIVSKYVGKVAFAAISGSVTQILNLMVGAFMALTGGAAVYIAQLYGIGDSYKIKKAVTTSMYICGVIGTLMSVFGLIFSKQMLILLKTPDDTLELATIYLKWCFGAAVFVIIYNMGASIIRASGDSTKPFLYLVACSFTNIVLDVVFVKVFEWGVLGAAIATAFSQLVSAVLVMIEIVKTDAYHKLDFDTKYISATAIKASLKYGVPSAMQQVVYGVSNVLIQVSLNMLGTTTVAAWSLTSKVDGIYWAISAAIGTSVMNFVGQNYGAGKLDRVKKCTKISITYFMIFTVSLGLLLGFTGESIFPMFMDDGPTCRLAYELMVLFMIGYPSWSVLEVLSGMLKGCGDVVVPTIICVGGIAGIRLLFIYTIYDFKPTVYTLAVAYLASWFITTVALIIRYKQGKWKKRIEL